MNKICFLLIYLLCFKRISPETCDKFDPKRSEWFVSCRPPCHCTAYPGRDVYCVLDDERECIGCAKSERKGSCTCSGDDCRCEQGQRYCNNYCVSREEMCDGKCEGNDRVCKGRCIRREETCDGINCGELDYYCNGECVPQTTTCYGKSYSAEGCGEGQWKCNGVCIGEHQKCIQKCNEALGYWMCGNSCRKEEKDMWESNGPVCQRKSTTNNVNGSDRKFLSCSGLEWICNERCIKRSQICNGKCNVAEGDWLCGSICKNQDERGDWITYGKSCKKTQGNQIPTLSTNTQASPIPTSITPISSTNRNETDTQARTTSNGTSPLLVMIIVGAGAGFILVVAIIIAICLYCRNKKKKRKEIQYIDDNPEYNYGEADDDIEVVDYNDYYENSDEETHV